MSTTPDAARAADDWATRFWSIVDGRGLLGVPSDEWEALRILVDRAWELENRRATQTRAHSPETAAVATLTAMGYSFPHEGGERWKPPLGERPVWLDDPAHPVAPALPAGIGEAVRCPHCQELVIAYRNDVCPKCSGLLGVQSHAQPTVPGGDAALRNSLSLVLALARLKWGNLDPSANVAFAEADAALSPTTEQAAPAPAAALSADLDAISAAIGSTRFMDPPDGGSVSLAEQVLRMRLALEKAEAAPAAGEREAGR